MASETGSAALDATNREFHEAYGRARDGVRQQVAILVLLPNELVLHREGQRSTVTYSCPSFAAAKSAAHIAVALFALTCAEVDGRHRRARVARLLKSIAAALRSLARSEPTPVQGEITALLEHCLHFAQAACKEGTINDRRADFAASAGPSILRITELATCKQIAGLHEAAEKMLRTLSIADQAELQVVIVGDHQARTRSLGMQYFKRRFHEQSEIDVRVTYGENITDEEEAISLVATRRLDKQIAQAFFGDDTRLQRDVLGDAAKRCLDGMCFPPTVSA